MTRIRAFLQRLRAREDGTALIETAIVAPVLIVLAVGGFETSAMVARQSELQSAAEQATEIALATVPDTDAEKTLVQEKVAASAGLPLQHVDLSWKYRCGSGALVDGPTAPSCSEDSLNTYIALHLSDEYQPVWTEWGFGTSFEYHVRRTVQIS